MCEKCEKFSKNLLKKNKGVPLPVSLSTKVKRRVVGDYLKVKDAYSADLIKNMRLLIAGKMSKVDYLSVQKKAIHTAFSGAYSNGKIFGIGHFTELDETERRFIGYQVSKEMQYMSNFADDITTGSGKIPYIRRMNMYSESLDSMFGFGRLVYMPDDAKIIWQLGATDKHCIDCLVFSSKNPYTKKTLPGYPKSGAARCLSNCRCSIIYLYNNTHSNSDYDNFVFKNFNKNGVLPTEAQYKDILDMRSDYYYNRGMFELTKNPDYKEQYLNIQQRIKEYKKQHAIYYNDPMYVGDFVKDIKAFNSNSKFNHILDVSSVRNKDMVSVFLGDKQVYGKVVNIYDKMLRVKFLDNSEIYLDPTVTITFKEK